MKQRALAAAFAGVLAALAVAPAAAQAYKWTDAQGKVHFSDAPPPDREAKKISIKPQVPEDPAAASRNRDWRTQLEESGVRRQQEQNRQVAEQSKKFAAKGRCQRARSNLDLLNREGRIYRTGWDGQREYLDDKDRPAAIQHAQERVDRECR